MVQLFTQDYEDNNGLACAETCVIPYNTYRFLFQYKSLEMEVSSISVNSGIWQDHTTHGMQKVFF